jgi:hypothetical protein
MNAIPYDAHEEEWDADEEAALPRRPRRTVLTWWSAGLFALIVGAVGFYAGVRVEKGQLPNSASTSPFSAVAAAGGRTAAAGRTAAVGRTAGAGRPSGGGGFPGVFGGGAGAGGSATFGAVSSISGNSLFVTDASGNTVKVTVSSATKVTKSVGVGKKAVRPGDLVVVSGIKGSNGTVSAATVSDTGSTPAAGGGSRNAGTSGEGRSGGSGAVNQLFGGG